MSLLLVINNYNNAIGYFMLQSTTLLYIGVLILFWFNGV